MIARARRWWLSYVLTAVLISLSSCTIWLALLPAPMYYDPVPFRVLTPDLHKGDTLRIVVGRCTTRPLNYTVASEMINLDTHEVTDLPTTRHSLLSAGCVRTVNEIRNVPPPETPRGRYILRGVSTVQAEIRTYRIAWYTEEFRVSD